MENENKLIKRCKWVNEKNALYLKYHDEEWGVPSHDDKYLFEMLILESFQAGLSWECILNKREAFRLALDNFDYKKIAAYDEKKQESLMNNKEIVRNKRKILAAINNAQIFMNIQKSYDSFDNYIWSFTKGKVVYGNGENVTSSLSDEISKDLSKRGMKFVGSTIIYSYLQAIGIINDHESSCSFH
ncbi:MAG: DNA-3-methyladenine glycosylase I [Bacilli bacterium]|nr:DNA-3-methyladenine glycosylase I [Bacilli bacterium]